MLCEIIEEFLTLGVFAPAHLSGLNTQASFLIPALLSALLASDPDTPDASGTQKHRVV